MSAKDLEEGNVSRNDNVPYSQGEALQRMVTAGTIPPDIFERLYLQPQVRPPT